MCYNSSLHPHQLPRWRAKDILAVVEDQGCVRLFCAVSNLTIRYSHSKGPHTTGKMTKIHSIEDAWDIAPLQLTPGHR